MGKFINQYIAISNPEQTKWEETPDGFLRCKTRVLAERVMPYACTELSDLPEGLSFDSGIVQMLVAREDMNDSDSLRSLEGVPVVDWDHTWLTPEVLQQVKSKGSVAGAAYQDGPYLICDLLVTDLQTIQDIKDRKIGEVSAAYTADTVFESGVFDGIPYDAKQTQLRFNHIAVIPEGHGRAGQDVRIMNNKSKQNQNEGDQIMSVVKVQLKNTGKFINTDEEGAQAVAEESDKSGKSVEALMKELADKNVEFEALQAEVETLKGGLSTYKEEMEKLLAEETIEAVAEGMIEEQGEAQSIIENALDADTDEEKKSKETIVNSIKKLHGTKLHTAVLSAIGMKVENMTPEAMKGVFKAHHQICNSLKGRAKKVVGSEMIKNSRNVSAPKERTMEQKLGFPTV